MARSFPSPQGASPGIAEPSPGLPEPSPGQLLVGTNPRYKLACFRKSRVFFSTRLFIHTLIFAWFPAPFYSQSIHAKIHAVSTPVFTLRFRMSALFFPRAFFSTRLFSHQVVDSRLIPFTSPIETLQRREGSPFKMRCSHISSCCTGGHTRQTYTRC